MNNKKKLLIVAFTFFVLGLNAQTVPQKPVLTVGDPAPALEVEQWLKGAAVNKFEKGRLYVVEFWATWCAPCNAAMPHLSELARKYQDKVTIIGVSVWEGRKKPAPTVSFLQNFVNEKGKDMDYVAAMDNPATDKIANTWLKAAGIGGIPSTFVIDKGGKIVWIGHPDNLEPVLEAQVNSPEKFNLDDAKEKHKKDFRQYFSFESEKVINKALTEKNYGKAWEELQKIVKEYPPFEIENSSVYVRTYLSYNSKAAMAYVLEKSKDVEFLKKKTRKNDINAASEELLDDFARSISGHPGLEPDTYLFAVDRLKNTLEIKPNIYNLWSLLAQAYANLGEFDKAIAAQEKGMDVFKKSHKSTGDQLSVMLFEKSMGSMSERVARYNEIKKKKLML